MYTPHKVSFYVYAESEEEAKKLQNTLINCVKTQYNAGTLVTAKRLQSLLASAINNPLISNYLKS